MKLKRRHTSPAPTRTLAEDIERFADQFADMTRLVQVAVAAAGVDCDATTGGG